MDVVSLKVSHSQSRRSAGATRPTTRPEASRLDVAKLFARCAPETTPEEVTGRGDVGNGTDRIGERRLTFRNLQLNPRQAVSVVSAWRTQMTDQPGGSLCQT